MNNWSDFTAYGYQILEELGRNREGGRITWKAKKTDDNQVIVLKQFCFATIGSDWSGYQAYEREIEVLEGLTHPGIPRYLGSFETNNGFCLIQEYKNAPPLSQNRSFEPEEIKIIAIKLLEILVYLQNRIPPIIHRDIKPDNILVDAQLNVYLIDFGFARVGSQDISASSVFKGTPGFIPPEQIRKPTEASDLYSLGASLICLLTGYKSANIYELTSEDDPYKLEFKHLLPRLSLRFIQWLEKMVEPKLKDRFHNAEEALTALKPLYIIRIPEALISQQVIEVTADKLGEKIKVPLTVSNSIPETTLEGKWEVIPHSHDNCSWISLEKPQFSSNLFHCNIKLDTSLLKAATTYHRQLILNSNANPETQTINLKVHTAPLPIENKKIPYLWLSLLLGVSLLVPLELQLIPLVRDKVMETIENIWNYEIGD